MSPSVHHRLSVLVVDDSAIVRHRLRVFLIEDCRVHHVIEAADGAEAWRLFGQLTPDVVLLDIRLPDNRGFEVLCRIKRAAPCCPVIILTNLRDSIFRDESRRRGADHFLNKATEFEQVADLLHRYANRAAATTVPPLEAEASPALPQLEVLHTEPHDEPVIT